MVNLVIAAAAEHNKVVAAAWCFAAEVDQEIGSGFTQATGFIWGAGQFLPPLAQALAVATPATLAARAAFARWNGLAAVATGRKCSEGELDGAGRVSQHQNMSLCALGWLMPPMLGVSRHGGLKAGEKGLKEPEKIGWSSSIDKVNLLVMNPDGSWGVFLV